MIWRFKPIDFKDSFNVVNLSNADTVICAFDNIQLNEYLSPDVISWNWDFGNNTTSSESNPEYFYENIGTSESYNFVLVTNHFEDISVTSRASIDFIDLDGDCQFDEGEGGLWIEGCVAATENDGSCQYPDHLYVSFEGYNDGLATNCGPGTIDAPLTSIQEAIDRAERLDDINTINLFLPHTRKFCAFDPEKT